MKYVINTKANSSGKVISSCLEDLETIINCNYDHRCYQKELEET